MTALPPKTEENRFLPPLTHRPSCRPFRWNPLAGQDRLRIYVLTKATYYVVAGESKEVVAELRTRIVSSLARSLGSVWILLVSIAIAWIANQLRNPEVAWALVGVGLLGTLTFGGILLLDFIQILRLPRVVLSIDRRGQVHLFDGKLTVANYQSLGLRTNRHKSNALIPTGSQTSTVDLVARENGRQHHYQLMATLGAELGMLARKLSTETGIPLESELVQIVSQDVDSEEGRLEEDDV